MTTPTIQLAGTRCRQRVAAVLIAAAVAGLATACSPTATASAPDQADALIVSHSELRPIVRAAAEVSDPGGTDALGHFEQTMLRMVNDLRASLGVAPLERHADLELVARGWSREMAATGRFEHNSVYSSHYPPGWLTAAENIAFAETSEALTRDTIQRLVSVSFDGLVESPQHYANMTDPRFTHIGIGVARRSSTLWTTQNFAEYPSETDRGTD